MNRAVNEGFSGGEKKRNEIFQMAVLEPQLAILDETDSGLDIDALKIVANGVNALRSPERAMIVITHYQRLLNYIVPDFVHVLCRRPHRQVRRQGAGPGARGEGLRSGSKPRPSLPWRHRVEGRGQDRERRDARAGQLPARVSPGSRRVPRAADRRGCARSAERPSPASPSWGSPPRSEEEWRFTNWPRSRDLLQARRGRPRQPNGPRARATSGSGT